jgi:hypothetical protein
MKLRISIWSTVGLMVAAGWILYSFAAPPEQFHMTMSDPAVRAFAYASCPIALAGRFLPLSFWLVAVTNAATYGVLGLIVEMLRRKSTLRLAI